MSRNKGKKKKKNNNFPPSVLFRHTAIESTEVTIIIGITTDEIRLISGLTHRLFCSPAAAAADARSDCSILSHST